MLPTRLMVSIDEELNNAIQEMADFNNIKKAQAIRDALEQYVQTQSEIREAANVPDKLMQYVGKLKHEVIDGYTKQREIRSIGRIK